jgi:hypothetical protein
MQEEFGSKGFSVLAVTSEGTKLTEEWIEKKGARYAYAYDKAGKLGNYFGVRGIPHSVLVDATGTVVWRGHPGMLDETIVSSAIEGALKTPMWEWGADARGVRKSIMRGDLGKALEEAHSVESVPDLAAQVQALIARRMAGLESRNEAGDFLAAAELADELKGALAGLPEGQRAAELAASIAADPEAQRVIKGQRKVAKIRESDPTSSKKISSAVDDLRDLAREFAGTFVETEADALIAKLQDRIRDR